MKENEFISIPQAAKLMGISRIAVYKKVKKGEIKAIQIGRNFAIKKADLDILIKENLNIHDKRIIDKAIQKTIHDYGQTLKLLGKE